MNPFIRDHSEDHFGDFPEAHLFEMARNEAIEEDFRLEILEIMVKKGFKKANHPDLAFLKLRLDVKTNDEIELIFEQLEEEDDAAEPYSGPLKAGVTTSSLHQPVHFVDSPKSTPADEAEPLKQTDLGDSNE